jgi:hypothetical protein
MKSTLFCDITAYSPLNVNRRFGKIFCLHRGERREAEFATCFHAGFLLGLFFDPEDGSDVPPKRRLTFSGVHGVISEKIILFKSLRS